MERLIQLKDIINEMGELKLEPAQWDELINLQDLLKKAYDITIRLQYSDVIPGYFFRKWTGLHLVYEEHDSVHGFTKWKGGKVSLKMKYPCLT